MNSEDVDFRAKWLRGPAEDCPPLREAPAHPWRLILLGAPGVGKGTQADLLHQRLKACHLSTGDVFRAASGSTCDPSPAMKAAQEFMRRGELVPDATVWHIVRERVDCLQCRGGFILDGFPRTLVQAEALKGLLDSEKISLTAVINYELPLDEIVSRLSGRRTCLKCKAVFHATQQPSRVEGICDGCGGRLQQRADDRPEAIAVRMDAYQRSTTPLVDFYSRVGLLTPVPAFGSPQEICARTMSALVSRFPETANLR